MQLNQDQHQGGWVVLSFHRCSMAGTQALMPVCGHTEQDWDQQLVE